ncbi:alpha/beta hydrolase, partial [Parabacteroides distasonis]
DAVNDYCKVISDIFDKVAAGMNIDEVLQGYDDSSSLKPLISQAKQTLSVPFMRHLITIDVRKLLPEIKCPVLAVNGKLDTQVDCTANLGALEKGLVNSRHEIVAFDSLNHLFQHCTTGS